MADGKKHLEPDDVKEGTVTVSENSIRGSAAKRKTLIESPDGTPGKDLAIQVQREIDRDRKAAPIIKAAVKDAQDWDELHGQAALVTRRLAEKFARLRALYDDKEGRPDMRGSSMAYREAASSIYEKAGFDTGKAAHVQGAVRYHLAQTVRAMLKTDERFANGDEDQYLALCEYYRLNPKSAVERQAANRQAVAGGSRLPALRLNDNDTPGMLFGIAQYAHKALDLPGDVDPNALPDDQREAIREELTAVRDRADEILASFDE